MLSHVATFSPQFPLGRISQTCKAKVRVDQIGVQRLAFCPSFLESLAGVILVYSPSAHEVAAESAHWNWEWLPSLALSWKDSPTWDFEKTDFRSCTLLKSLGGDPTQS